MNPTTINDITDLMYTCMLVRAVYIIMIKQSLCEVYILVYSFKFSV